jgi:ribose 5-phosphate isomerase A
MDDQQRLLRLATQAAAEVQQGTIVGLGSGSTAEAVVEALGRRVAAEGVFFSGVATSHRTSALARSLGISLRTLDEIERIDLGIDGADEIAPNLDVVKGRGGALLYEKIVAMSCDRFMIVASSEKEVEQLGTRLPLPVEIMPLGWRQTLARIEALGLRPRLRKAANGFDPYVTDGGHWILDCDPSPISDPPALATALKGLVGVVEHGLFIGIADRAMVVDPDGTVRVLTRT